MYKNVYNRLSLPILIVEKAEAENGQDCVICIVQANTKAKDLIQPEGELGAGLELYHFFPIADTELRYGNPAESKAVEVQDTLSNVDYRIVIQAVQENTYCLELHRETTQEEIQPHNRQLIQFLKHEVLKLISKEAFFMGENEYLKRLLNNLPALVAIKDSNFRYRYVNSNFAKLTGLSSKDLIGKTDFDFCSPEDATKFREMDTKIIQHNITISTEEQYTDSKGITHYLYTKKIPSTDNNGNMSIQVLSSDISEIKAVQKELVHIKAQYEEVAQLSKYVVWLMNMDFSHSFISPSIKNFQGYEPEEFLKLHLNQSLTESSMQKAAQIREEIALLHANGDFEKLKEGNELEMEYYHKDGHIVRGRVVYKVALDEQNNIIGVHGSTIEI